MCIMLKLHILFTSMTSLFISVSLFFPFLFVAQNFEIEKECKKRKERKKKTEMNFSQETLQLKMWGCNMI